MSAPDSHRPVLEWLTHLDEVCDEYPDVRLLVEMYDADHRAVVLADALATAVESWEGSLAAIRSLSVDPELTHALLSAAYAYRAERRASRGR